MTTNSYYHRTLEMNNAAGRIENITIEDGRVRNENGGNLRLVTGVVSNCVIRGGIAVADGSGGYGLIFLAIRRAVSVRGISGSSILMSEGLSVIQIW